jgi:hypothetical protein
MNNSSHKDVRTFHIQSIAAMKFSYGRDVVESCRYLPFLTVSNFVFGW